MGNVKSYLGFSLVKNQWMILSRVFYLITSSKVNNFVRGVVLKNYKGLLYPEGSIVSVLRSFNRLRECQLNDTFPLIRNPSFLLVCFFSISTLV